VSSLEGKSNEENGTQETDKDFLKPPETHEQEAKSKTVKKNIVKVRVVVKCNKICFTHIHSFNFYVHNNLKYCL